MKVRARIELFATENSGRASPLQGSFRPNHRFNSRWFVVGEVQQLPDQLLAPGEVGERIVKFLPDGLPSLKRGQEWQICEGPEMVIGRGTVLDVLVG
jgi:hypothetical protein